VLVSPLDWGLGHTTRCIPLIRELLLLGCEVIIACNSIQKELLNYEFSDRVGYTHLAGYGIRYGKNRRSTFARLMLQSFKILTKIKEERRWLKAFLQEKRVDFIISDNRFGLYAAGIPTVFITHQLQIKTGLGRWADGLTRRWNYLRLQQFSQCWVPDIAGSPSLSGELSHPSEMPTLPVRYIGPLSRLEACTTSGGGGLLIILSGPEPQRSIFEGLLLEQLTDYKGKVVLVRGLPSSTALPAVPTNCTVLNHAPANSLHGLICAADLVISRCGYTTVMDLIALQKKSIMVPTPGQAEQEYLARHLQDQQWAYTLDQKGFVLNKALAEAERFEYRLPVIDMEGYKKAVRELVFTNK
jgi:UDP:flavonoid glycosyltransferase YjiC (YdhE family)